jgi:hypothetical protein
MMFRLRCKIAEDIYSVRLSSIETEETYNMTGRVMKKDYDYPLPLDNYDDCSSTDSLPSDDENEKAACKAKSDNSPK